MPSPKKAAKKATQQAARKTPGHGDDQGHQRNDLRRAYEHMGRLGVLLKTLPSSAAKAVGTLMSLAQNEIQCGFNKSAADLLRASENMSFAALAGDSPLGTDISFDLKRSIVEHFDELLRRADEHLRHHKEQSGIVSALCKSAGTNAVRALHAGAYYRALEFARAAEALAHVRQKGQQELAKGASKRQLKSTLMAQASFTTCR
jgi:hypothetical protein